MQRDIINGQDIDIVIIAPDGTEALESLNTVERDWLEKIDVLLRNNTEFANSCPDARLVRIDSNRGFEDRSAGRFYLRYAHSGGMMEYWGNIADISRVNMEQGIVCVKK